jgi:hypothetical protein
MKSVKRVNMSHSGPLSCDKEIIAIFSSIECLWRYTTFMFDCFFSFSFRNCDTAKFLNTNETFIVRRGDVTRRTLFCFIRISHNRFSMFRAQLNLPMFFALLVAFSADSISTTSHARLSIGTSWTVAAIKLWLIFA